MAAILGVDEVFSPHFNVSSNFLASKPKEQYNEISRSLFVGDLDKKESVVIASQYSKLFILNQEKAFTNIICSEENPFYFAEFSLEFKSAFCNYSDKDSRKYWKKPWSCKISQALYVNGTGGKIDLLLNYAIFSSECK